MLIGVIALLLGAPALAQASTTTGTEAAAVDPALPTQAVAAAVLPRDTPVHLMVVNEVTTKTHDVGHRFKLRVNQPVSLNGAIAIPAGATAWGTITSAEGSGNVGKSGNLSARLLFVEVGDRKLPISGETSAKGKSGTAETVMGVVALGVFGLFAKGNNAKIKAGELMTAFTTEDFELAPPPAPSTPAA